MALAVVAAPAVAPNETMDPRRHIDPGTKEVSYNPKYEDMFAPMIGPDHPFKTETQKADKNTLSGKVEPAHLNEFQFELQRRTFHSYGFAQDPSNDPSQELIGSSEGADSAEHKTGVATNSIFLFSICTKSLICLKGKTMTRCRGKYFLYRSSQQLPCLCLGSLKGFSS